MVPSPKTTPTGSNKKAAELFEKTQKKATVLCEETQLDEAFNDSEDESVAATPPKKSRAHVVV